MLKKKFVLKKIIKTVHFDYFSSTVKQLNLRPINDQNKKKTIKKKKYIKLNSNRTIK